KPDGHKDTAYLVRIIKEQEISTIHFVPSMLQLFLGENEVEQCLSLKRVICSGEAIPPELPQRFYERLNAGLHNLYGPTEASVDVTFWPCERERVARSVPIGRPITNIQVYLLDSKLNGVAIGAAGELHIGGIGLARGYLKQPALTAERFIPNPFGRRPGERLYKTGDLARYFPDGTIEFLGRIDHQVKVHGFRIELGEVESVLSQHPAIQEVVVQPKGNENGEKRLVAYFVSRDERGYAVDEPLRYKLPNNMEVACQNENEVEFLYREIFVRQSYMKHGITLEDGDCVFDVGANVGLFTLFMNEVCREVKVYAFEPIPPIYELLRRNVEHYAPTARVFNCGLSNVSRRTEFTYYPKSSIMSGYYADAVQDREVVTSFTLNEQQQWIDAGDSPQQLVDEVLDGRFDSEQFDCHLRTLSSIISEHRIERIDLLKIDVEKSEADVLDGIEDAHWPLIRQVVVEVHDLDGRLRDIIQLLKAKGYKVKVEQESWLKGTVIYDVYATRSPSNNHDGLSQPLKIRDHLSLSFSDNSSYVEELRSFTRRRLPAYMVPSTFIRLENLPLSSNGKIDRKALPDPDTHRPELSATYVLPKTEMEQAIAALWQEVLKMDKVGIYDNFFDLGGYSLIMGMVRRKLEVLLNVEIAMVEMFEHPTVHSLAKHLSQPQSGTPTLQPDHDRARKQREAVRMRRQLREGETRA
ncbi:MAG TPA: FkbM family methyltransferase, partial [Pyrinomonadaceae bacterium]|nr:FkbM family methyltransferase [Pyrinomonadaceae bacterium]